MTKNKTVLVVDDDADDRFLAKEALTEVGYAIEAHFMDSGEDAIAYLKNCLPLPSLILLDWNMPCMSGKECLETIKNNPYWRKIPVLIFSTSISERDVSAAYEKHANSYFQKPATYTDLAQIIKLNSDYWLRFAIIPG